MKNIIQFIAVLMFPLWVMLLLPSQAFALPGTNTVTAFTWTPPTSFADGTPATASDITGYNFYWATQGGTYSDTNRISVNAGVTSVAPSQLPTLSDGTYQAMVDAVDSGGHEGLASTNYLFTVSGGVVTSIKKLLNPPTGLTSQ